MLPTWVVGYFECGNLVSVEQGIQPAKNDQKTIKSQANDSALQDICTQDASDDDGNNCKKKAN
jgi:hypothetical protein